MTILQISQYIENGQVVRIWQYRKGKGEEIVYEGDVGDIPIKYAHCPIEAFSGLSAKENVLRLRLSL